MQYMLLTRGTAHRSLILIGPEGPVTVPLFPPETESWLPRAYRAISGSSPVAEALGMALGAKNLACNRELWCLLGIATTILAGAAAGLAAPVPTEAALGVVTYLAVLSERGGRYLSSNASGWVKAGALAVLMAASMSLVDMTDSAITPGKAISSWMLNNDVIDFSKRIF